MRLRLFEGPRLPWPGMFADFSATFACGAGVFGGGSLGALA